MQIFAASREHIGHSHTTARYRPRRVDLPPQHRRPRPNPRPGEPLRLTPILAALALIIGCATPTSTIDVTRPVRHHHPTTAVADTVPHTPLGAAVTLATAHHHNDEMRVVLLMAAAAERRLAPTPPAELRADRQHSDDASAAAPALEPCGGDLPPCWRVAIESGGNYTALNAGGCGGNNCYGKYQFSGAWAGKLGLPVDIANATPAEQDTAARALWADGAGCGNWSACG